MSAYKNVLTAAEIFSCVIKIKVQFIHFLETFVLQGSPSSPFYFYQAELIKPDHSCERALPALFKNNMIQQLKPCNFVHTTKTFPTFPEVK